MIYYVVHSLNTSIIGLSSKHDILSGSFSKTFFIGFNSIWTESNNYFPTEEEIGSLSTFT